MKFPFSVMLCLFLIHIVISEEEEASEEKYPWDKSTDWYMKNRQSEDTDTEDLDTEVHSAKSKVRNLYKKNYALKKKIKRKIIEGQNAGEKFFRRKKETGSNFEKSHVYKRAKKAKKNNRESEKVDRETNKQYQEVKDIFGPDDARAMRYKNNNKQQIKHDKARKKEFNYHGDFYPGSLWEYPYPYFHPMYDCGAPLECPDCGISKQEEQTVEAKEDESAGCQEKAGTKPCGGAPPAIALKPKGAGRQLIPSHYYGPPSAGWGAFKPGQTGCSWGVPYWLKRHDVVRKHLNRGNRHHHRQIIPTHYYGPPSAGWGGFQPGQTGTGWGAPYWYKKRHGVVRKHLNRGNRRHHRQIIPTHYYGPPSAGWGGFQPGQTGTGWGAPYWYKSHVQKSSRAKKPKYEKASRKFAVINNDLCALGHVGACSGWDSGFGIGHASTGWGAPNNYGWSPVAHYNDRATNVDFGAWFGPKSFGKQGWGGSGWVGDYGYLPGNHQIIFASGNARLGSGADFPKLDERIGAGDLISQNQLAPGGFNGRLDHNSFTQGIGYNLAYNLGIKNGPTGTDTLAENSSPLGSNIPVNDIPVEAKESDEPKEPIEAKEDRGLHDKDLQETTGVAKSFQPSVYSNSEQNSTDMVTIDSEEEHEDPYKNGDLIGQLDTHQLLGETGNPDVGNVMREQNENPSDLAGFDQVLSETEAKPTLADNALSTLDPGKIKTFESGEYPANLDQDRESTDELPNKQVSKIPLRQTSKLIPNRVVSKADKNESSKQSEKQNTKSASQNFEASEAFVPLPGSFSEKVSSQKDEEKFPQSVKHQPDFVRLKESSSPENSTNESNRSQEVKNSKENTKLKMKNLKDTPIKSIEKKLTEAVTQAIEKESKKLKAAQELKRQEASERAYSTIKRIAGETSNAKSVKIKNEKSVKSEQELILKSRTVKTKAANEKPVIA